MQYNPNELAKTKTQKMITVILNHSQIALLLEAANALDRLYDELLMSQTDEVKNIRIQIDELVELLEYKRDTLRNAKFSDCKNCGPKTYTDDNGSKFTIHRTKDGGTP